MSSIISAMRRASRGNLIMRSSAEAAAKEVQAEEGAESSLGNSNGNQTTMSEDSLKHEFQRRQMIDLLAVYRRKISRLETSLQSRKNSGNRGKKKGDGQTRRPPPRKAKKKKGRRESNQAATEASSLPPPPENVPTVTPVVISKSQNASDSAPVPPSPPDEQQKPLSQVIRAHGTAKEVSQRPTKAAAVSQQQQPPKRAESWIQEQQRRTGTVSATVLSKGESDPVDAIHIPQSAKIILPQVEKAIDTITTLRKNFNTALAEADERVRMLETENRELKTRIAQMEAAPVQQRQKEVKKASREKAKSTVAISGKMSDAPPGNPSLAEGVKDQLRGIIGHFEETMAGEGDDGFLTRSEHVQEAIVRIPEADPGNWWPDEVLTGQSSAGPSELITASTHAAFQFILDQIEDLEQGMSPVRAIQTHRSLLVVHPEELQEESHQMFSSLQEAHTLYPLPGAEFPPLEPLSSIARHVEDYCGPTDESNWVVPGWLLVGAFPAVVEDEETTETLLDVLHQGVTTFVCLQEEYNDDIEEYIWRDESSGAIRPYFADVRRIVKEGTADPNLYGDMPLAEEDLNFVHFPIVDCDIAEDSAVYELAGDLVRRLASGQVIYMHCWGGHGRTGSLVCVMLHLMYGMSAYEAMTYCQFVHDLRRIPMEVPSPQKATQRNQVRRIIRKLIYFEDHYSPWR